MAELFVVNGVCGGTAFSLPDVPTVLGRSPECHVQVLDPWISSMHALFERRADQLWIVDLDSRNGTFVDDERVHEAPVVPGARLRFGKTAAELRLRAAPPPQAVCSDQRTIIRYISDLALDAPRPASGGEAAAAAVDEQRRDGAQRSPAVARLARREIGILNEVARAVSGAVALEDALERLLRVLAAAVGSERSSVLLVGDRGEMVRLVAHPEERPARLSATVVQATLRSRAGILTLDALQDQRFASSPSVIAQGIRSCISAPIWADDRILGVVLLERGFADPFGADDLELATLAGFHAALAVERARVAEQARAAEQRRALLERYVDAAAAAPLLAQERGVLSPALRDGVAALAVSLEGLAELAAARAPAEAARRAFALQHALADAALADGAVVDAQLDGGVLAIFGLLHPVPDAARRAVRCATELVRRAAVVEEPHPAPRLAVKVGVEAGSALAGNFGSLERPELRAAGVPIAAAQRLAHEAAPGEIVCGETAATAARATFPLEERGGGAYSLK